MSKENPVKFEDFTLENILDPDYKVTGSEVDPTPDPEPVPPATPPATPPTDPEEGGENIDDEEIPSEGAGQVDTPPETPEVDFKPFLNLFHEKLGWEVPEENLPENSMDGFIEYMNNIVQESSKPQYANELSEKFDKFLAAGGDPSRFMNTMFAERDYNKITEEASDSDKKQVLTDYLIRTNPEKGTDWIERKIERYETSGVLDDEFKDALDDLKEQQAKERSNILAQQEAEKQKRIEAQREYLDNLQKTITSKKDFGGIPVQEKDKKGFYEFLTKPDKNGQTEYHKATQQEDASLIMAYLAYKKFNVNNLVSNVKSDVVKDIKKSLSKFSSATAGLTNKTSIPAQSNKIDYKQFDIGT